MRIPLSLGPPREDLDKEGEVCCVYDVVFHSETIEAALNDKDFRGFVLQLAAHQVWPPPQPPPQPHPQPHPRPQPPAAAPAPAPAPVPAPASGPAPTPVHAPEQIKEKHGDELSEDFKFPKLANNYKGLAPLPQLMRRKGANPNPNPNPNPSPSSCAGRASPQRRPRPRRPRRAAGGMARAAG